MRVILDTNVLISGIFFGGAPGTILEAWRDGRLTPVLSLDILEEYERVGQKLRAGHPGVDPAPVIELIAARGRLYRVPTLRRGEPTP